MNGVGPYCFRDIAQQAIIACIDRGLLVNKVKANTLRFIPPLTIGNREVDEALGILDEALSGIRD